MGYLSYAVLILLIGIAVANQQLLKPEWSISVTSSQSDKPCNALYKYEEPDCGGIFHNTSGTLSGSCCCGGDWFLITETGKGIVIDFSAFSVPGDCTTEYLEVRLWSCQVWEGSGNVVGKYCDSYPPPESLSIKAASIRISFVKTNRSLTSFAATWKSYTLTCCGPVLLDGSVYSPMLDGTTYRGAPVYYNKDTYFNLWYLGPFSQGGWNYGPTYASYSWKKSLDAYYCPEDNSRWLDWDGHFDFGTDKTLRCSNCTLNPANNECLTCCSSGMGSHMGGGMGGGNGMGGNGGIGGGMGNGIGGSMGVPLCCPAKKIYGSPNGMDGMYTNVGKLPWNQLPYSCNSPCVYERKDSYNGMQYCFADSMTTQAECDAAYDDGEEPVDMGSGGGYGSENSVDMGSGGMGIGSGSGSGSGSGNIPTPCPPKQLMDKCNANCVGVPSPPNTCIFISREEIGVPTIFETNWTVGTGIQGQTINLNCPNQGISIFPHTLIAFTTCGGDVDGAWTIPAEIQILCGVSQGSGSGTGSGSGSGSGSGPGSGSGLGSGNGGMVMGDHGGSSTGGMGDHGGSSAGGMGGHGSSGDGGRSGHGGK